MLVSRLSVARDLAEAAGKSSKRNEIYQKKTNGMAKVHSNTIIKIIKRNGKELIEKQN